jgi:uncharacterized repeat protein (TIGR01451 family)
MSNGRTTPVRRHVRPRAVATVACLALVAFAMAFVHSGSARAALYPLAPYGDTTGTPVCDGLDMNPSYADIACNSTDNASAYIGSDGVDVTAAFIDHVDPRSNAGQAPLLSTAYVVQIAVGGTQVATIGVDGKGTGDSDLIYAKCAGNPTNTWSKLFSTGVTDGSAAVTPEPGPEGYYRMSFTIPLSSLASCGVTATTGVQLFYGTSQAGNLDVINKDFFRGSSVDFTGLATIQFGGGFGVAKTSTSVSGPNPPVVNQTSVYDLVVTASNTGLYQVNAVSVSDPIPAGVAIVSVSATAGTASSAGQNVTWSGFNLQAGGSQSMTIRVSTTPTSSQIGAPVVLNPGANATGTRAVDGLPQSATSNAVSTGNVSGANIAVTKTAAPLVVQSGGTVTYTITLTNSGNLAGAVTSVVDHLPTGFSYSSGSTTGTLGAGEPSLSGQDVTWSGAFSVPAAASRTLVFDAQASANPGNASNTVDVSGGNFTSTSTGSTATVHVNGPPVANADSASVPEDGQVTVSPLTNDSDPDGDTLSVSSITQPSHGTAVLNPDGTVTYTPAPNYNGPDSFTVTVCDPSNSCATSTVNVTVVPVNDPPVANPDTAVVGEDGQTTVSPLSNDSDPDGDPLSVSTVGQPSHGTTTLNPDGTVIYTPAPNYNGPDSFTVTVCDPSNSCATSTVTVTVVAVNDPPVATNDSAGTPEDTATTVDVLANDTDVDGNLDPASVSIVSAPSHGTAGVLPDHTIAYTPAPNYNGPDSFTYQVCDTASVCDTATVSMIVSPVNDPPVIRDDATGTQPSTPVIVPVLVNDTDVDGDTLSVSSVTQPANGTAVINANGTITYTPAPGFTGPDAFTYTACDPSASCGTATVRVSVPPQGSPPVAANDSATTAEGTPVGVNVVANDSDPDSNLDPTTLVVLSPPTHGTALASNGNVAYFPQAAFNGVDSLTYQVCDTTGLCDSATLTITVTPVNHPPVAGNDAATTTQGQGVTVDVLPNDSDPDGDTLTIGSLTQPAHGATAVQSGKVRYTPAANYAGTDTFTYTACDPAAACDSATVTITVVAVPRPPAPADDVIATEEGHAASVDVLANDTDPDGDLDPTSLSVVGPPLHGTAVVTAGRIIYTPSAGYQGADTFTYQVCDATHLCGTAAVLVDVTPVDQAPVAADDAVSTGQAQAVHVDVLANDTDPDGQADIVPSSVTVVAGPAHGTVTVAPDGTVTYTPAHGFVGNDSFTYRVCDVAALCDTAVASVQVVRVPEPPVAVDDSGTSLDGKSIVVDVVANDTDPQNSLMPTSVKVVQPAAHGTEAVHTDGTVTYTPAATFTGEDSLRYQVCNTAKLCSTAVVALSVERPTILSVTGPDASSTSTAAPAVQLGALAFTGAQVLGTVATGLLLLVGGALLLATTRRRRTEPTQ